MMKYLFGLTTALLVSFAGIGAENPLATLGVSAGAGVECAHADH
jgi:hypothetical protein